MNTAIEIHSVSDLLGYLRGRPGHDPLAPTDVNFVAGFLGVDVWEDHLLQGLGVLATLKVSQGTESNGNSSRSTLCFNAHRHTYLARRRMTLAHMLGHVVLHADEATFFTETEESLDPLNTHRTRLDTEAQDFADEMLMPSDVVRRLANAARDTDPIAFRNELAARFEVPQRDMALRMERLSLQTEVVA